MYNELNDDNAKSLSAENTNEEVVAIGAAEKPEVAPEIAVDTTIAPTKVTTTVDASQASTAPTAEAQATAAESVGKKKDKKSKPSCDQPAEVAVAAEKPQPATATTPKATEAPAPKKPMDAKKKKILTIITAVAIAIVLVTLAIVIPIVVINANKIFVSKPEDFLKTKGHTYVLEKNIEMGDLTLGSYSIDLNKKTLTINGNLTIDANSGANLFIGTVAGKSFDTKGGILVTGNIIINAPSDASIKTYAPITATGELKIKAGLFESHSQLTSTKTTLDCANALISGELNGFVAQGGKFVLNANSLSKIELIAASLYAGKGFELTEIFLDENSEVYTKSTASLISGKVDENGNVVSRGKMVFLDEGSDTQLVKNVAIVKVYNRHCTFGSIESPERLITVEKLATPARLTTETVGGSIFAIATKVSQATSYTFFVDEKEVATISTNKLDVTSYLTEPGAHKVTVVAKGENTDTQEFIDSEPVSAEFTYSQQLSTPSNIRISAVDGKYMLSFASVAFADQYRVDINGSVKIFDRLSGESVQTFDVSDVITKAGDYSIVVVATSKNNLNFSESEKGTGHFSRIIQLTPPVITAIINDNDLALGWEGIASADYYYIYKKVGNSTVLIGITTSKSYTIKSNLLADNDSFFVSAAPHGNFTESLASNTVQVGITEETNEDGTTSKTVKIK